MACGFLNHVRKKVQPCEGDTPSGSCYVGWPERKVFGVPPSLFQGIEGVTGNFGGQSSNAFAETRYSIPRIPSHN